MKPSTSDRQDLHLNHAYLKNMRNKCTDWIQELNDELDELKANGNDTSAFEKAFRASRGKPFVFDEGNMRSLHFDQRMMQSAMWIDAPNELAFGYTKAMMGFLLVKDEPKHILMIGLGGGSLAKYCHRHLSDTRTTVVEIDANVIALRDQFLIPRDDERLKIVHMDAVKFVEQSTETYDVILLDGFDADGLVSDLLGDEFIHSCHQKLDQDGILVANIWGKSKTLISAVSRMSHIFNDPVWWCHSSDSYNLLTFAFKSDSNMFHENLQEKAKALDSLYKLELPHLANRVRRISKRGLDWAVAPSHIRFNLKKFFFQEAIEKKVAYFYALDEMLVLTNRSWLGSRQTFEGQGMGEGISRAIQPV